MVHRICRVWRSRRTPFGPVVGEMHLHWYRPNPLQAHPMKRQSDFQALYVDSTHFLPPLERALASQAVRVRGVKLLHVLSDICAFALALLLSSAFSARLADLIGVPWASGVGLKGVLEVGRLGVLVLVSLTALAWFWGVLHHYSVRRPFWDEVREVALVVCAAFLADSAIAFFSDATTSRLSLASYWASALLLLLLSRTLTKSLMLRCGWLDHPCVFIGQGPELREALAAFDSEPLMGFKPVALLHPLSDSADDGGFGADVYALGQERRVPVYPLTPEVGRTLMQVRAKLVFVMGGADAQAEGALQRLRQDLSIAREDVFLVPPMVGLPLNGMQTFNFFSHEVLLLRATNKLKNRSARLLKRVFDVTASGAALLLLSPLLLYVAWRIRRESPGPALFKQQRIGLNGAEFGIFKFRSMVLHADKVLEGWKHTNPSLWAEYVQSNFKLANDPRITPIGRFIRRTSIDELPQLINVFLGHMSLVGPRPLLARELDAYGSSIDVYTNVRPGISGLWQISGRSSTTFDTRIALDRWYIRNWSFWHDIVILFKTVKVVFRTEGAY
jgi:Undecaprenyl-phosphate galactose phosphotransferase WbaP